MLSKRWPHRWQRSAFACFAVSIFAPSSLVFALTVPCSQGTAPGAGGNRSNCPAGLKIGTGGFRPLAFLPRRSSANAAGAAPPGSRPIFPAARNTASGERRSPPGHRLVWPCSFRAERRMSNGTPGGRWNRTSGYHSRHIAGFSPARIPRAVSRHIRLDPSSLGKLWVNPRELTARDFSLAESSESGGILCVFPAFGTARIGEKSRCSAEGDLFRDSLKEHAAHFGAGKAGRIQTGIHWGVQPLLCHLSYRLMCPRPAFAGRDLPLSCPASPVSPGSSKPRSWVVSCIRP